MPEQPPVRRVEASFVGTAPAEQVRCASGVSEVETDGSILRCLVCGSFQPFLEALRGHEVICLSSTSPSPPAVGPHWTGDATCPGSSPPPAGQLDVSGG